MPKQQLQLVNTFYYHHQPYNCSYNNMIYPFTFSTTTPTTTIPSTTITTTTPRQASHLSDAYTTSYGQVINNKAAALIDHHHHDAPPPYPQVPAVDKARLSPTPQCPKVSTATSNRTCYECNHTFTRPRDLRRHLEQSDKHNAERKVWCDSCFKTFTRYDVMRRHYGKKRCLERRGLLLASLATS